MHSWDLIRCFLALHRTGSYEAAGQAVGLDHSTMRRKIQALEVMFGATIFVRCDGKLQIKRGNEKLLERALEMEAASMLFSEYSESATRNGVVRISTIDIFANLLAPDFARFKMNNPNICLHITTEPHLVDLERDAVDIAIRLARPTKGQHGIKRLCSLHFGVFKSRGTSKSEEANLIASQRLLSICTYYNLADHDFELADHKLSHLIKQAGNDVGGADTYSVLLRLCEEGLGLAMLPLFITSDADVVSVDCLEREITVDAWVAIRRDVLQSAKIRLVIDFLTETFHKYRPLLEGKKSTMAP